MKRPYDLYRWFDKDDVLLYIGISFSAFIRASAHRSSAGWYTEAVKMTIEHGFPDEASALAAETKAIELEKPKYNIAKNGKRLSSIERRLIGLDRVRVVNRAEDILENKRKPRKLFILPEFYAQPKGWIVTTDFNGHGRSLMRRDQAELIAAEHNMRNDLI